MKKLLVGATLGTALFAVSCGGIDRDGSADELVRTLGVDKDTASCIVDDWIDNIGEDRVLELEDGAVPTAAEEQAIVDALTNCST